MSPPRPSNFHTTRWSLVASTQGGSIEERRLALGELCELYRSPLLAYLRARGWREEDAEDLVQGFLAELVESPKLQGVDPRKGSFRGYLLGAIKNYAANHRRRERVRPWQAGSGQGSAATEGGAEDPGGAVLERLPSDRATPEQAFERDWARTVIRRALEALEAECRERGHGARFDELEDALDGSPGTRSHRERAERLGIGEGAVRVALLRLRGRLAEWVQTLVGQTVSNTEEVDIELGDLFEALAQRPGSSDESEESP